MPKAASGDTLAAFRSRLPARRRDTRTARGSPPPGGSSDRASTRRRACGRARGRTRSRCRRRTCRCRGRATKSWCPGRPHGGWPASLRPRDGSRPGARTRRLPSLGYEGWRARWNLGGAWGSDALDASAIQAIARDLRRRKSLNRKSRFRATHASEHSNVVLSAGGRRARSPTRWNELRHVPRARAPAHRVHLFAFTAPRDGAARRGRG